MSETYTFRTGYTPAYLVAMVHLIRPDPHRQTVSHDVHLVDPDYLVTLVCSVDPVSPRMLRSDQVHTGKSSSTKGRA